MTTVKKPLRVVATIVALAQRLIENGLTNHPEACGLEISATPSRKQECVRIVSAEANDLGEKRDKDEREPPLRDPACQSPVSPQ